MLSSDFGVYTAYRNRFAISVSLLVKRPLAARMGLVNVHVVGQLVVTDIVNKSCSFRVIAFYAPNHQWERS